MSTLGELTIVRQAASCEVPRLELSACQTGRETDAASTRTRQRRPGCVDDLVVPPIRGSVLRGAAGDFKHCGALISMGLTWYHRKRKLLVLNVSEDGARLPVGEWATTTSP